MSDLHLLLRLGIGVIAGAISIAAGLILLFSGEPGGLIGIIAGAGCWIVVLGAARNE